MNTLLKIVSLFTLSLFCYALSGMQMKVAADVQLFDAIIHGDIPGIDAALAAEANIRALQLGIQGVKPRSALLLAYECAWYNKFAVMDHLIKRGAQISDLGDIQRLLRNAVRSHLVDTIQWLLAHGVIDCDQLDIIQWLQTQCATDSDQNAGNY